MTPTPSPAAQDYLHRSKGLIPRNLTDAAKHLAPILTPLRNSAPRLTAHGPQEPLDYTWVTVQQSYDERDAWTILHSGHAPFATQSLTAFVSREEQANAPEDACTRKTENLLRAAMIAEERNILFACQQGWDNLPYPFTDADAPTAHLFGYDGIFAQLERNGGRVQLHDGHNYSRRLGHLLTRMREEFGAEPDLVYVNAQDLHATLVPKDIRGPHLTAHAMMPPGHALVASSALPPYLLQDGAPRFAEIPAPITVRCLYDYLQLLYPDTGSCGNQIEVRFLSTVLLHTPQLFGWLRPASA